MSGESTVDTVVLPSGWRETPLRTVATVRFSSVDKLSHESEVPVKLCNYTDVYSQDYITAGLDFMEATATDNEVRRFALEVGDVLITKDSETPDDIGVPTIVDETLPTLVCGYHLGLIRPDPHQVDSTFLGKQIAHRRIARYFAHTANGLTRHGLPIGAVEQTPIWLPPISAQTAIGAILRKIDALIDSSEAVLAKLRQVRAGLLHDLLTRGLDADGQLRDPDAHPDQFKDSPLGRISGEWEIDSLVSRISFPQGQVDPRYEPYCHFTLVAPDHIESETGRLLERATAAAQGAISGKYLFAAGDVLYSKIRPYLRKAVLADGTGLCSADMYPLRPQPGTNPKFLLAVMLGESFSRFASAVSMRSGFPKINRQEMAEYQLAWPLPDEQNRIADIIESHDDLITAEQSELTKLRQLKSGLMTDLLEGRVRVPEEP